MIGELLTAFKDGRPFLSMWAYYSSHHEPLKLATSLTSQSIMKNGQDSKPDNKGRTKSQSRVDKRRSEEKTASSENDATQAIEKVDSTDPSVLELEALKALLPLSLNKRAAANLKKSMAQIGQLAVVIYCKQHPEKILSGRHRTNAGGEAQLERKNLDVEKIATDLQVPHELAETLVMIHANVQRRVKKEETRITLLSAAKDLEASGIPKQEIANRLSKILPYTHAYILKLLPDDYKQKNFAVSTGRPAKSNNDTDVKLGKRSANSEVTSSLGDHDSSRSNDDNSLSSGLDSDFKCEACGKISTRGDIKQVLLGKECRRKLGMKR